MPKLNEETKLKRISQTMRVMGLVILDGKSQEEACREVGITPYIYNSWLHSGEDTIETLRGYLIMLQRVSLSEIVAAQSQAIRLHIKDLLDPLTSPKDRVIISRYLDELGSELQRIHHAVPGIEEQANAFLKQGPTTSKKKSRLASIDIERDQDSGITTVNIYEENDVIDVTPSQQEILPDEAGEYPLLPQLRPRG
jgi:hypothetical protein